MDHDSVAATRRTSAAWRLLRADTAPLVISFLGTVFIEENIRSIPEADLVARLDDFLYAIGSPRDHGTDGEDTLYPRSPQAYVDHWAHPETGWLRAWYPPGAEEPHYDATPAVEHVVRWVKGLRSRAFVGTESRLATVFDLLRQLAVGTTTDPTERLNDLLTKRAEIDAQIAAVQAGRIDILDAAAQRDRYQQLTRTAAELLSDLREVETNFRALDRRIRQRITAWDGAKGTLLEDIVAARDAISNSDQGRSFHAFYDFLLDRRRQEEFANLVDTVRQLSAFAETPHREHQDADLATEADLSPRRLRTLHYDWLAAGEQTQATVRALSEQLRRFLDDRVWVENRRVLDILRSVEAQALAASAQLDPPGMTMDAISPTVTLPLERPLWTLKAPTTVESAINIGDDDFEVDALYHQVYVDPGQLAQQVRAALVHQEQVHLVDVVDRYPLQQGLAELVAYLALDDPSCAVTYDDDTTDTVTWTSTDIAGMRPDDVPPHSAHRAAQGSRVTYSRRQSTSAQEG